MLTAENPAYNFTVGGKSLRKNLSDWAIYVGSESKTGAVYRGGKTTYITLTHSKSGIVATVEATIYEEYARLASAPRFVIPNTGYIKCSFGEDSSRNDDGNYRATRTYSSFLTTTLFAKAYEDNLLTAERSVKDLVAVTTRTELDGFTANYSYSYVAAAHSADFLSSDVLSNASYANYDILSALINNISRVDEYASISLGGISENSTSYGGKMLRSEALSEQQTDVFSSDYTEIIKVNYGISKTEITIYAIITAIAPIAALAVGIVVRVKRKFL